MNSSVLSDFISLTVPSDIKIVYEEDAPSYVITFLETPMLSSTYSFVATSMSDIGFLLNSNCSTKGVLLSKP